MTTPLTANFCFLVLGLAIPLCCAYGTSVGAQPTDCVIVVDDSAHSVMLPKATEDFEYFLEAETAKGDHLVWPSTAPRINQTVVVAPTAL